MSTWKWCLLGDDDKLAIGWNKVGDYYYYFYSNGVMAQSEWFKDANGYWFYLDNDGKMLNGFQTIDDKKYYFYESGNVSQGQYLGAMACNITLTIENVVYTFDDKGVCSDNDDIVSYDCVNFVKGYEGFSATQYYDGTGNTDAQLTIGYGATKASEPEAFENTPITEETACYYLKLEITKMAKIIKSDLDTKGISLSQSQQDALYSFTYNCGQDALLGSTLYKYICSGGRDADTITSYFCMWDRAGGVELAGLKARRIAEANIFNNGIYDSNN